MIMCDQAIQTVNIYYSVIKFLDFKGIVWVGDGLPLVLNSLGELFQSKVTIAEQGGKPVTVPWERGLVHAEFEKGKVYDITMRLEYCIPTTVTEFVSDFSSIHPKSYRVGLDFSSDHPKGAKHAVFSLAGEKKLTNLNDTGERTLEDGHHIKFYRERDYCSFSVENSSDAPYAWQHFPVLSVA